MSSQKTPNSPHTPYSTADNREVILGFALPAEAMQDTSSVTMAESKRTSARSLRKVKIILNIKYSPRTATHSSLRIRLMKDQANELLRR